VYCTGAHQPSDQNLKQNIHDFSTAMNIINQLRPKHYEYRHDGNYKFMNLLQGDHFGLIAQDVEKVLPNLVKDTKFETRNARPDIDAKNSETINFKALNYTELIPIIIKGMQELDESQKSKLKSQNDEIVELKSEIESLKSEINELKVSAIQLSTSNNSSAYLLQNTPNPFSQNTIIRCYVPSSVK